MQAKFETQILSYYSEGTPLRICCQLQEAPDDPVVELAVTIDAKDGWVDAAQLIFLLRAIANTAERSI